MQGERDGHTLQTTALINELYLRLSDLKLIDWQNDCLAWATHQSIYRARSAAGAGARSHRGQRPEGEGKADEERLRVDQR